MEAIEDIRDKLEKVVKSLPYCLYEVEGVSMKDNDITVIVNDTSDTENGQYEFAMPIKGNVDIAMIKQFVRYIKTCLVDAYKQRVGSAMFEVKASLVAEELMYCSKHLFDQIASQIDLDQTIDVEVVEICNKKQVCFVVSGEKTFMDISGLSYYAWEQLLRKWSISRVSDDTSDNMLFKDKLPPNLFQRNAKTAKALASILINAGGSNEQD